MRNAIGNSFHLRCTISRCCFGLCKGVSIKGGKQTHQGIDGSHQNHQAFFEDAERADICWPVITGI